MSLPQVTSYWARLMFSGRNLPPQRLDSEADGDRARAERPQLPSAGCPKRRGRKGLRTVLVLKETP